MKRTIPFLWAGAVVAVAWAAPAAAQAPPRGPVEVEAVGVFADRPTERLGVENASVARPDGLLAAWVWSRQAPPRRVDAEDLAAEIARHARGDQRRLDSLRIRVPSSVGHLEDDLEVVAAPVEMFEEVPESWLPRWPLSRTGSVAVPREPGVRWRVRLVGRGRGSGWHDAAAGASELVLSPDSAADHRIHIADAAGRPLPHSYLTVLEDSHGSPNQAILSHQRGDEHGVVEIRALPEVALTFVASAAESASRVLRGRATELPGTVRLPSAASVHGRLVDEEGRPVASATIRVEGWLDPEVPVPFVLRGESDEEGWWNVGLLPPGASVLLASAEGFAPLRRPLELVAGERRDLGVLPLAPGAALRVAVVDDNDLPVPGAVVALPGRRASTGEDGSALLADLRADTDLTLQVTAGGFLPAEVEIRAPWPRQALARITRAFVVRGRFVAADGLPLAAAAVRITQGQSFRYQDVAADGRFEIELPPRLDHTLQMVSPAARELRVEVDGGLPGEELELGELLAPPGIGTWGRLVSAVDGSPIVGARVWTPRASDDRLASWLHGDLLQTRSDELGYFELGGLEPRPELLRIDALGFARVHVPVQPAPDEPSVDLGTLELSPGVRLRVVAEDEAVEGAMARFDLRGEWMDLDMLTASFRDGVAEIPHVPAGDGVLTVLAGGELLCERRVAVTEGEDVEVECGGNDEVSGVVLVGERAAGAGRLIWSSAADLPVKATIFNRNTPLGAAQQQVVGAGRPAVRVEVGDDGTFTSSRLATGRWNVVWEPLDGLPAAPRALDVPEGGAAHLLIRVEGTVVAGRIVDEAGLPVDGARVHELTSGAVARGDVDGDFRLTGLAGGDVRLQARDGDRFSAVVRLTLSDDRPPDPVELVLSDDHEGRLEVRVAREGGAPAAGALVFFDTGSRGLQVVSADGAGLAEWVLAAPYPARARIAAFHEGKWGFSAWCEWSDLRGFELEVDGSGEIVVVSDETSGRVEVTGPHGWDVSAALAQLGVPATITPDRALVLGGLPDGTYLISDGSASPRMAAVSSSRRSARIELD